MEFCADCIWFDAPGTAYLGRCVLTDSTVACNHGCAKFAPLPRLRAPEAIPPELSAPQPVPSLLVHHGGAVVRKCGACGSLNMGPKKCNACGTNWR